MTEPTARILSIDGGGPSEIEYLDENNTRVGYWAYGSYDPAYPYQGQSHPQKATTMLVSIPEELIDKALDAVGLVPTKCRDGIVRTASKPGCVDCKTKSAFVIDGVPYCAKHAREQMAKINRLGTLRDKTRELV